MRALEDLGRVRLSPNFFMRDFLHSEIANFYGVPNIPQKPELAISTGARLCRELLEPLQSTFGRIAIRSGYRSPKVTAFGNARGHGARIDANAAYHIWDMRDENGRMGAAACVVIPWFADRHRNCADWLGGYTITWLMRIWSSTPSSALSTFDGMKARFGESTASSSRAVV